uniref:Uncharacterized protein n=1 Tax=Parascaris equorum TaxID=6256 RepID=A0A914RHH6_PAREQ
MVDPIIENVPFSYLEDSFRQIREGKKEGRIFVMYIDTRDDTHVFTPGSFARHLDEFAFRTNCADRGAVLREIHFVQGNVLEPTFPHGCSDLGFVPLLVGL